MSEAPVKDSRHWIPFSLWIVMSALIAVLDQLTKIAIVKWVPLYDKIPLNAFINITHQENRGAAFSILANAGSWGRWFFIVLTTTISGVIIAWLYQLRKERLTILSSGLILILGGALGNLIDRIRLGYVIDFFQVLIAGWPFPSFNVADSAISVGAALIIIDTLFISGRKTE